MTELRKIPKLPSMQTQSVTITTLDSKETQANLERQHFSQQDRVRNALKYWLGLWGVALPTLFIPIVHFLAFPVLIISGIYMGVKSLRMQSKIMGVKGTCPNCGNPIVVKKTMRELPLKEICRSCRIQLIIK
jgi:hypothetical protein